VIKIAKIIVGAKFLIYWLEVDCFCCFESKLCIKVAKLIFDFGMMYRC